MKGTGSVMQRTIKFRLRDRHNNIVGYERWYEGHWHFDNDLKLTPDSGYWEAQPCWLYSEDGKRWTPTYIPHRYKDQYTGLKDKNNEIYEGDIVKSTESTALGCVCYRKNASFGVYNKKWGKYALPMDEWEWEVIGNIYENPELLEGK